MPDRASLALKDAAARDRMRRVLNRLAKRLGMDEPGTPSLPVRYPQFARAAELEHYATFLETVDAAMKDEGYRADGKPDAAATDVEITDDGTPVVVTGADADGMEPAEPEAEPEPTPAATGRKKAS